MFIIRNVFLGERIVLTPPYAEDAPIEARWFADSDFARHVDTDIAYPRMPGWYERKSDDVDPTTFHFQIRLKEGDLLIGFVALHSVEFNNQAARLAIGIGDVKFRGGGYGREAMELILGYAFLELNLNRVGLDVIEYNAPARRLYEKQGFQEEGRARECVYRDGKRHDLIYMGILRREWEALRGKA